MITPINTVKPKPPTGVGPLQKRETRLAWGLLAPTLISVALVVLLPLLSIFWISVKPIQLADLRPVEPNVYERFRGKASEVGDEITIEYRLTNRSKEKVIESVTLFDVVPQGLAVQSVPENCTLNGQEIFCELGDWEPGYKSRLQIPVVVGQPYLDSQESLRDYPAEMTGISSSDLFNANFTLDNFSRVFDSDEFVEVLWVTIFYTVFGTIGALVVGMMAALLLNKSFKGQGFIRGLLLFPYVAPVIAVAFTWVTLFDPFSGSANALLIQMGAIDAPINFFGEKPLALISVTVFEIWRYFPLSFLFILARMQSIDADMYEAARMDGASPFQQFWYLSIPQLLGILSVLFLLRFIWTFNKFDDIFLLTGGNAGTRTLTVNVYEQAFALSNIGAGAAVAVVVFLCLLLFSFFFFRYVSREEGL
ncbi:carbohydrate ABC transporter permease [Enterovibrio paralichthyis]|uniref:carbohydrate ABC transporter permease n=1 Tax=Enterovibrio paralichthyis TaxID=2853805 RepID=UPI001C48B332|nr:sugar ABC transporter permease [Enterovibrio paralichthyis]MBV7298213.1 sugar ABC transporter permease [Enterovibrio paralichthyis]